jgi:glycosyltransferase involved in cell wall biosynthesis
MRESSALLDGGHRVALIAMHDKSRGSLDGIELLPLPYESRTRWQRIKLIPHVYRMARAWPADVYHVHEMESLLIGILLKWRTGAKLIFDSHECFHHTAARFLSGFKARVVTAMMSRVVRWMSRRADHVIVVSFTSERFYREFCGCPKVTIIHNCPAPDMFPCTEKSAEARRTVTHNGNLTADRGVRQILEALTLVKQKSPVRFLVFGLTREAERDTLQQRTKELDLEDVVEIVPWMEYDRLGVEMNRGSIGLIAVQPTANNLSTLHNKLFNYMATGQAVIGPVGSDTAEVLSQTDCGVAIDTTDPQALAEAILSLITDEETCARLGANGRRAVETEFGFHKMGERLLEIYRGLEA